MLQHVVFKSLAEENAYWATHPSAHMVKCIVIGGDTHVWLAETRGQYNGGHMVRGGVNGDGSVPEES